MNSPGISTGMGGMDFDMYKTGMQMLNQQQQPQQQPQLAQRQPVADAPQVAQFNKIAQMAQSMPSGAQAQILTRLGLLGAM
jgi:hypothetical protein